MKCEDCVSKNSAVIGKAEFALVEYDFIKLLCKDCLDEYCHIEGEINLDFYHLEIGLLAMFKRIDEVLKYHSEQYSRLLKEYSTLKKKIQSSDTTAKGGS